MKLYKAVSRDDAEIVVHIFIGNEQSIYSIKPTTLAEIIEERITEEEIKELIMLFSKASIVEAHGKKYTGITTDINKAAKAIMDKLTKD